MELILTVAVIHLLACLSPGPDIFLVVLNSLRHGWRTGVATTAGILTGVSLHITFGIAGISLIVAQSERLAAAVSLAGGAWLVWLGLKGWQGARKGLAAPGPSADERAPALLFRSAWSQGLLVNLLNPKALLFFLSLFSVLLGPGVATGTKILCGAVMLTVQGLAFGTVALLVDRPGFKRRWTGAQAWLERGISLVLFGLGLWIWGSVLLDWFA